MKNPEYNTVTVEAARTGWIVKEQNRPTEIFVRWEMLIRYLENRLTSKGDPEQDFTNSKSKVIYE